MAQGRALNSGLSWPLELADRALSRGEHVGAATILLQSLRGQGTACLDDLDAYLGRLVVALGAAALDEEVIRTDRHLGPGLAFLPALCGALIDAGREPLAQRLQRHAAMAPLAEVLPDPAASVRPAGAGAAHGQRPLRRFDRVSLQAEMSSGTQRAIEAAECVYVSGEFDCQPPERPWAPPLRAACTREGWVSLVAAEVDPGPAPGASSPRRQARTRPPSRIFRGLLWASVAAGAWLAFSSLLAEPWSAYRLTATLQRAQAELSRPSAAELRRAAATAAAGLEAQPTSTAAFGYAFFLEQWRALRFDEAADLRFLAPSFALVSAAPGAQAGLIAALLHQGRVEDAAAHLSSYPEAFWHEGPAYHAWARGAVGAARGEHQVAVQAWREAAALDEGLRLVALVDLAALALETEQVDVLPDLRLALRHYPQAPLLGLSLALLETRPMMGEGAWQVAWEAQALLAPREAVWAALADGMAAAASGRWTHAIAVLQGALQEAPNNPRVRATLALSLIKTHRVDEAVALFQDEAPLETSSLRVRRLRRHLAQACADAGRPDAVLAMLGEAILPGPDGALQVRAWVALGRQPEAGMDATLVAQLGPLAALSDGAWGAYSPEESLASAQIQDVLTGDLARVMALAQGGELNAACESAAKVAAANPGASEAQVLRAQLLELCGQREQALEVLGWGSEQQTPAQQILAALYLARGPGLAQDEMERVLAWQVTDLALVAAQAEVAWRMGRVPQAQALAQQVVAVAPKHRATNALLAMMDQGMDGERRLAALRVGWQGALSPPGLLLATGRHLEAQGDRAGAERAYKTALQQPISVAEASQALATVYLSSGRRHEGRKRLMALKASLPVHSETRALQGHLAYWLGVLSNPESGASEAERFLREARDLLGDEPLILYQLARVHSARKRGESAQELLRQIALLDPDFDPRVARLSPRS